MFFRWDKRSFPRVLLLSPPQTERGRSQGESCEVFHTSTVCPLPPLPALESGHQETTTAVSPEPFSSGNPCITEKMKNVKTQHIPPQAKAPRSHTLLTARWAAHFWHCTCKGIRRALPHGPAGTCGSGVPGGSFRVGSSTQALPLVLPAAQFELGVAGTPSQLQGCHCPPAQSSSGSLTSWGWGC